jgi:hypothetical protein
MKTIPTNLPGHLIDWYWQEVEDKLVRAHGVDRYAARTGIDKYRRALHRVGVGDIQYHEDAKKTARGFKTAGYTD